jgi:hypothetical protein
VVLYVSPVGRITGVEPLARLGDGRDPVAWFHDADECDRTFDLDAEAFM